MSTIIQPRVRTGNLETIANVFAECLWSAEAELAATGWCIADVAYKLTTLRLPEYAERFARTWFCNPIHSAGLRPEMVFNDVPRTTLLYLLEHLRIGEEPSAPALIRFARMAQKPVSFLEARRTLLVPIELGAVEAYCRKVVDLHSRRREIAKKHAEILELADVAHRTLGGKHAA